jgi:hypothetical protein
VLVHVLTTVVHVLRWRCTCEARGEAVHVVEEEQGGGHDRPASQVSHTGYLQPGAGTRL